MGLRRGRGPERALENKCDGIAVCTRSLMTHVDFIRLSGHVPANLYWYAAKEPITLADVPIHFFFEKPQCGASLAVAGHSCCLSWSAVTSVHRPRLVDACRLRPSSPVGQSDLALHADI